ncbi:MAG: sterol desaturase family protein [Bacteriovoracaceae bacterium]
MQTNFIIQFLAGLSQVFILISMCALAYFFIWKLGAKKFSENRLDPSTDEIVNKQIKSELKTATLNLMIGFFVTFTAMVLSGEITNLTSALNRPIEIVPFVLTIITLYFFNDLWFYLWHRALHTSLLFRYIHFIHHKSRAVNPFSSYSMHMIEGFLFTAWVFPILIYVPIDLRALFVMQILGTINNIMSHLGHEFLPLKLIKIPILKNVNTATYHSMHHLHYNGNYGLLTRVWDRMFGTELEGYEKNYERRKIGQSN